jgi:hypothetical protein
MGASAAITLKYVGQGPSGDGQIIADQTSGPKSKTLYGYGTLVSGSDATTAAVNFVDGVAGFGKKIVLRIQSVAASDGTNSVYSSTDACGQVAVGDKVTVTGCSVAANNVSAANVVAVTSSTITVVNSTGTAESGLSGAVMVDAVAAIPVWVNVFYAGYSGDSATAAGVFATGANHFQPSSVSSTGFTLNYPTVTTSAVSIRFGAVIAFSS